MSKLICDICGTSYSADEDKCPTCGYSRAMAESAYEEELVHETHEKVRGGRFSKKNVLRRVTLLAEPAEEVEAGTAAAVPAEQEPLREDESAAEAVPVVIPEPEDELEAMIPVLASDMEDEMPDDDMYPESEEAEERKKAVPLLWFIAIGAAVVVLILIFLLTRPGQPGPTEPSQTVEPTHTTQAPTDAPTDPPTEPPTDPPTEPPTDPPTEAPTDPPTEPPTEAPTKPLLDVKLELNWYDLTFTATDQATRLKADGIPSEDITWVSDDPAIATVSETGVITPVSGGRTTIRAIYGDQEAVVKVHCSIG